MNEIKGIAEKLLGRQLSKSDGLDITLIRETESRLGIQLPPVLSEFYLLAGNNKTITSSFQRFSDPGELYCEDNKLVFLEENQDVCFWGIDLSDLIVYQCQNGEEKQWYSEEINLPDFLRLNIYYQFAQGGYEYVATLYPDVDKDEIKEVLALNWEKVVDHNHLIIYCDGDKLIWHFTDQENNISENLFLSTRTKEEMDKMIAQYNFAEL